MIDDTPAIQTSTKTGDASPQPDAGAEAAPKKKAGAGARKTAALNSLQTRIGHKFVKRAVLVTALTHVSALNPAKRNRADSYQRMEFLGDHVLGLVISDMLYKAFPKADEGELSKRLADLVRRETCADVARSLGLADDIKLGAVGNASAAVLRAVRRDFFFGDASPPASGRLVSPDVDEVWMTGVSSFIARW